MAKVLLASEILDSIGIVGGVASGGLLLPIALVGSGIGLIFHSVSKHKEEKKQDAQVQREIQQKQQEDDRVQREIQQKQQEDERTRIDEEQRRREQESQDRINQTVARNLQISNQYESERERRIQLIELQDEELVEYHDADHIQNDEFDIGSVHLPNYDLPNPNPNPNPDNGNGNGNNNNNGGNGGGNDPDPNGNNDGQNNRQNPYQNLIQQISQNIAKQKEKEKKQDEDQPVDPKNIVVSKENDIIDNQHIMQYQILDVIGALGNLELTSEEILGKLDSTQKLLMDRLPQQIKLDPYSVFSQNVYTFNQL